MAGANGNGATAAEAAAGAEAAQPSEAAAAALQHGGEDPFAAAGAGCEVEEVAAASPEGGGRRRGAGVPFTRRSSGFGRPDESDWEDFDDVSPCVLCRPATFQGGASRVGAHCF